MKYLIYFLLFSSVVFSQNYQYAIEEAKVKLPEMPTTLIVSQISETSVVLTWTAPTDKTAIKDYGIYSKNILLATSTGTGTTYKVTGLSPDTTYSVTVRSIDKSGKISVDSNVQTFATKKVVIVAPVLNPPTKLIASQISENSVVLTWTAPNDKSAITDYGIYSENILLATSVGTGTTYKVTGLSSDTAYSLTVRSIDKTGKMSVDSNLQSFTTNKIIVSPVLNPPTALIASQISETSVVLTWTAPADKTAITDYGIYSKNILLATSAGTGTTFKLTGLSPDTVYSLTVRSIDKSGKISVDSNVQTFTTKKVIIVAPVLNPPTALIASQISESSVVLTWIAPADKTGITDYGIYSKNILLATSAGTGTTYKVTGLTPDTAYSITVRSIDKAGIKSVDSNLHTFKTNKVVTVVPVLNPPTALVASQITETSVVLTWTAPTDKTAIKDYGIYSKNILLATSAGTGTTYKLTGLSPETSYSLTVRSIDKAGKKSIDSNVQTFKTNKIVVVPVLNPPTALVAGQITETSAVLNWTAPTEKTAITDYGIYSKNILLATSAGTGTTYKLTGLNPDTAYSLTVRSIDKAGKKSVDSNLHTFTTNKIITVVPVLNPPTALIASQITETSVVLSWTAPTDKTAITDYGIYSKNILLATSAGTGTTYKVTGLSPDTAYSLTVRSIDKSGRMSVDSNLHTFTTNKVVVVPVLNAPTSLIASDVKETSVVLNWTAPVVNDQVTDYGIYSKNIMIAKALGTGTTYRVTGLTSETEYSVTVRSLDKTGNMSVDSNIQKFTTERVGAPTGLVASQISETTVVLTWTAPIDNSSVKDYGIYSKNVLLATSFGTGTTYKVTGLAPETAYSLTVRSIDKTGKMSIDSNDASFTTNKAEVAKGVNNQLEEIEYFKAYLLPLSEKANIQKALDKYGSVRLEKGNYSGVPITITSNQRLFGHPSLQSQVSAISIAGGTTNAFLKDLFLNDSAITFQPGGVISGCTFKSIKWSFFQGNGIMLENNTFINIGLVRFDCSSSGYIRNNKLIRYGAGSHSDLFVMKGNSNTPSYGNVNLWTNFLTPHGDTATLEGLQSATFVGIDAEGWNLADKGTKAMFYARNMGDVKITDLGGGNSYGKNPTPSYDIEADNFMMMNRELVESGTIPKLSNKTNFLSYFNQLDGHTRFGGGTAGFDLKTQYYDTKYNKFYDVKLNDVVQTSLIPNSGAITSAILGTKYTPWARPNWETLPDPLGSNWKTERVGKPDSRAYIQNLIDTNKLAELPEGIFYISSTLMMPTSDFRHGIVGQGTGKTAIVGLTDDFPLISLTTGADGNFILSYLTLQGGSVGVYGSQKYGPLNIAYQSMKFVVFRDQKYGIHIDKTGGFDNNFLENLGFVNCNIGFYQQPADGSNSSEKGSAYVDKTMFYKNQFINCNTAVSMIATRADNLNSWVDCKFDGNGVSLDLYSQRFPIVANCDFTNHKGVNILKGSALSMYNCNFYNNSVKDAIMNSGGGFFEGCNFLDTTKLYTKHYIDTRSYIVNCTVAGEVIKESGSVFQSVLVNSTILSKPALSKILVNIKDKTPIILINETANPYPQLLVTQHK